MVERARSVSDYARIALAGIRLFNGTAALFAPAWLTRRLGVDPEANPAIIYVFRLFGIRTILIAADFLLPNGEVRAHALRVGVLIHASDATAAALAGIQRQLPPRAALTTTLLSTTNLVLAILARQGAKPPSPWRRTSRPARVRQPQVSAE